MKKNVSKRSLALVAICSLSIAACHNDAYNDNNSPSGSSYSRDVKGTQGLHNETDPQNTGGITNAEANALDKNSAYADSSKKDIRTNTGHEEHTTK